MKEDSVRMYLQKDFDQDDFPPGGGGRPERPRHTPRPKLEPTEAAGAEMDRAEYEQLLGLYDDSFRNLAEGEVVKGKVLRILPNEVVVDVGYKSEGLIDIEEFADPSGRVHVEVGDVIDVLLEKTENQEGYVVLSKEKAEKMKIWEEVEQAYNEGKIVRGIVKERIKGGLAVDIGVRAFLPGSLVDLRPVRNLDALRGKELRMRVIKVNRKRGNIVLSRKAVLEEENQEKKKKTLALLEEGKALKGIVKNITEYGAFIDLGGIDGLLHKTDMSWGRVNHPSELFVVGDEVEVVVLKFDPERSKARLDLDPAAREHADAKLRALQVGKRGERTPDRRFRRAHGPQRRGVLVVGSVAEIEPEHVDAGLGQRAHHLRRVARGSQSGDDARAAPADHARATLGG